MNKYLLLSFVSFLLACGTKEGESSAVSPKADLAQDIVDKCIEKHGGAAFNELKLAFDFRDRHYQGERNNGTFTYERFFTQEDGTVLHDILNNEKLTRKVNGEGVSLSAKDSAAYANSVNSVFYFALLPYFLNDPAVRKTYLGETTLKGQPYHKVKVTFRQEGGGKDFEDEYVYWIHSKDYTLDFLAYNYIVDGGGARFREAYNVRTIEGIRFADYINYQPEPDSRAVETFDQMFEAGQMKELSRIDTEDIVVSSK